jgi:hypothetical protein
MSFLPDGYEVPKTSKGGYMKFLKGDNAFRILSKPIVGYENWKDGKPVRFRMTDTLPSASDFDNDKHKHFLGLLVWNYNDSAINILQLTQRSIQNEISALAKDEDWGDPLSYDIKVTRTGDGLSTEYSVSPKPHKALSKDIKEAMKNTPVDLDALYSAENPFNVEPVADDLPF